MSLGPFPESPRTEWVKYVLESELKRLNDCKNLSLKKLKNPQLEEVYINHENSTIVDCDKKMKEVFNFIKSTSFVALRWDC